MYGEVVDGIDGHLFEDALAKLKASRGAAQDVDLSAEDLASSSRRSRGSTRSETGGAFPQDAREQLLRAVRAVFESWENPRAQVYRRAHHIADDLGTAVNVVQMVFGNKGARSGTGVAFTRDPSTGEPGLYGEFLADAQGEDVVAGHPHAASRSSAMQRGASRGLRAARSTTMRRLEEHYRDMQDIEFTVEDGQLYLLQTRSAKRTAAAALKCRRRHGRRGPDLARGRRRAHRPRPARPAPAPDDRPARELEVVAQGLNASPGAASGADRLRRRHGRRARRSRRGRDPRPLGDDPGRHPRDDRAQGILTAHGGMTSHAAVVARGMGKPCVAGCEALSVDARRRRRRSAATSSARAT